jgi:hypothetical protein
MGDSSKIVGIFWPKTSSTLELVPPPLPKKDIPFSCRHLENSVGKKWGNSRKRLAKIKKWRKMSTVFNELILHGEDNL